MFLLSPKHLLIHACSRSLYQTKSTRNCCSQKVQRWLSFAQRTCGVYRVGVSVIYRQFIRLCVTECSQRSRTWSVCSSFHQTRSSAELTSFCRSAKSFAGLRYGSNDLFTCTVTRVHVRTTCVNFSVAAQLRELTLISSILSLNIGISHCIGPIPDNRLKIGKQATFCRLIN